MPTGSIFLILEFARFTFVTEEINVYAHDQNQDPDWWMIVRNSLDYVECDDEISIETLD